jgi:3-isopropylmalate dehydrogenase
VIELARDFPEVELEHRYVDAASFELLAAPCRFDVVLADNLFGDILSDELAAVVGGIGLLASASLGDGPGIFEPVHGSAPDLAGRGVANPTGALLSGAALLTHGLGRGRAIRRRARAGGRRGTARGAHRRSRRQRLDGELTAPSSRRLAHPRSAAGVTDPLVHDPTPEVSS